MSQLVLRSLLLLSSILLGNLFLYSISKKKVPGMAAFSLLVLAMLIHSAGYAFELQGGTLDQMYNWVRAEYLGISWYPVLIVLFTREFTDEKKIANRFTLSFFATVNFVTFFLVQTNSSHWLYYSTLGVSISTSCKSANCNELQPGPVFIQACEQQESVSSKSCIWSTGYEHTNDYHVGVSF